MSCVIYTHWPSKTGVQTLKKSPKFYSFYCKKYHKSRSLTSRFSHNFHPKLRTKNSRLSTPLPSTDRPLSKRTFHTTDFTCRSEASTDIKSVLTLHGNHPPKTWSLPMTLELRLSHGNLRYTAIQITLLDKQLHRNKCK